MPASESVDVLIIGAGPAGLRAAQVLAELGREALVLEKRAEIGPKTCAGGLTRKAVEELAALGLPADSGLESVGHVSFTVGQCQPLDPARAAVRTVGRRELGALQTAWARAAGAEVRAGISVTQLDLGGRTALAAGHPLRWRCLIGADGADSAVRRALGLSSARACFACEYNVPGIRLTPLRIECDPVLASGYFWVFPHRTFTSIGAAAPRHLVPPSRLRAYLDGRMRALGLEPEAARFEGATLEVACRGFHFGDVHLVGDAAGVPSSLTAEGIHAALVSGEDVARRIVDRGWPQPKLGRWLAAKRRHDRAARLLALSAMRRLAVPSLARLAASPVTRNALADWFLDG